MLFAAGRATTGAQRRFRAGGAGPGVDLGRGSGGSGRRQVDSKRREPAAPKKLLNINL